MLVKLTKTIVQSRSGTLGVGKDDVKHINQKHIKVSKHRGKLIPFVEGTEVEMSDASAAKYIEYKWAVPVPVEAEAAE